MANYKGPLDYIDVAARIVEFRTKHPQGSLSRIAPNGELVPVEFREFGNKSWAVYTAFAYRDQDDKFPGVGTAWEPVPGPTQFTRDSELQNAETAAWGRAMVAALAVDTKKGVASSEEVRNRQSDTTREPKPVVAPPEGWEADVAGCDSVADIQEFFEMASAAGWWSPVVAAACTARKKVLTDG